MWDDLQNTINVCWNVPFSTETADTSLPGTSSSNRRPTSDGRVEDKREDVRTCVLSNICHMKFRFIVYIYCMFVFQLRLLFCAFSFDCCHHQYNRLAGRTCFGDSECAECDINSTHSVKFYRSVADKLWQYVSLIQLLWFQCNSTVILIFCDYCNMNINYKLVVFALCF